MQKEGRKQQARSYKQQSKATQHAHVLYYGTCMYAESKHLPRVLAKQYGEVLVDGEEAVKRIGIQQLPGSSLGQQVAEGPVGVGGSNQPLRSLHLRLRFQMEQLPTHIAVTSCRQRRRKS